MTGGRDWHLQRPHLFDLIIAGAPGHPRLWEKLLGGVTHDLMTRMTLPILMSH
jgi:nucleotide-binding universal stress UspA family protein